MRNHICYVENPAARNSEITDGLYVSPISDRIRNLQSAEPFYLIKKNQPFYWINDIGLEREN